MAANHDVPRKTSLTDHEILNEKGTTTTFEDAKHIAELTPEEKEIEKKLKRRIDSLIMPLVILVYLMNYIDRNNYAAARLQGLEEDLNLTAEQYQVCNKRLPLFPTSDGLRSCASLRRSSNKLFARTCFALHSC